MSGNVQRNDLVPGTLCTGPKERPDCSGGSSLFSNHLTDITRRDPNMNGV